MTPSHTSEKGFATARFAIPNPPEFVIVLLYEDGAAGTHAMTLCQHLVDRFSEDFLFRIQLQPFKSLADPAMRTVLTDAAREATLIFIAGTGRMPDTLIPWLNEALHDGKTNFCAGLVDLTSEHAEGGIPFRRQLWEFAFEHDLDFFDSESVCHYVPATLRRNSAMGLNVRHWGINE